MKHRTGKTFILAGLILGLTVTGMAAAAAYGSEDDPLVSASYITDVVRPEIKEEIEDAVEESKEDILEAVDEKIAEEGLSDAMLDEIAKRAAGIKADSASGWQAVKVPAGKILKAAAGCQFLLRQGSGTALSGLSDLSGGSAPASGAALVTNHLYMAGDGSGMKAGNDATLLIRGGYSIQ